MCIVQHRLVNCLHDGKERLAIVQHKVAQYLQQGVAKKPAGFGDPSKVSTQTCQVCLQDPKTYNQKSSLAAAPVMFEDIKEYSCSPMHMWMRVFEATWNAAVDSQVSQVECTRPGQPCTLHPTLVVIQKTRGIEAPRASACDAKEIKKREFQKKFLEKLGVRAFFPEPQKGVILTLERGWLLS